MSDHTTPVPVPAEIAPRHLPFLTIVISALLLIALCAVFISGRTLPSGEHEYKVVSDVRQEKVAGTGAIGSGPQQDQTVPVFEVEQKGNLLHRRYAVLVSDAPLDRCLFPLNAFIHAGVIISLNMKDGIATSKNLGTECKLYQFPSLSYVAEVKRQHELETVAEEAARQLKYGNVDRALALAKQAAEGGDSNGMIMVVMESKSHHSEAELLSAEKYLATLKERAFTVGENETVSDLNNSLCVGLLREATDQSTSGNYALEERLTVDAAERGYLLAMLRDLAAQALAKKSGEMKGYQLDSERARRYLSTLDSRANELAPELRGRYLQMRPELEQLVLSSTEPPAAQSASAIVVEKLGAMPRETSGTMDIGVVLFNNLDREVTNVFVEYNAFDSEGVMIGGGNFLFASIPPKTRARSVGSPFRSLPAKVTLTRVQYQ